MTLNEAFELFAASRAAQGVKPVTVATYRQRISAFADRHGDQPLVTITIDQVEEWARGLHKQTILWSDHPFHPTETAVLSKATIHGRIRALKSFFYWCQQRGHIAINPAADLRMPRYPKILHNKVMDDNDLKRILKVARQRATEGNPRDYAMIVFMADTGCRVGELCNMKVTDLNLAELTALVDGKGGPRYVAYTGETARAVRAWLAARPRGQHDYLFTGQQCAIGQPITRNAVYLMMKRIAIIAGVKGRWNPHSIRHLVGQTWADNNSNLALVQQKLGHRDINSTAVYANQNMKRVQRRTEELSLVGR